MLNSIVNQKSQIEATQVIGTPVQHSPESPPIPYMPYNSVELILAWTALFRALTILIQSLTTWHWYRLARSYKRCNTGGSRNQANLE
jgi:hypothetical protein